MHILDKFQHNSKKLKTKTLLQISLLALFSINAYSQDETNPDNQLLLTLAPLALIDLFDGASYRPGFEVKLKRNIAFAFQGGGYVNYFQSTKINPKGVVLKPSVKYYLDRQHRTSGRYVAVEYQYKSQDYDFRDSIAIVDTRTYRQYGIRRTVNCLSFKYGNLKNYGRHFVVEWYGGLGIRYMQSRSELSALEEDGVLPGRRLECPLQENLIRITGNRVYPNFLLGIKIGYRVK